MFIFVSTLFFNTEVNRFLWMCETSGSLNNKKLKVFALQTTVFIIKIIHLNDMVRHTSLQYQAAKQAVLYS